MKYVKRLPLSSVYDGDDIFGVKLYHSSRRRYKVFISVAFGHRTKKIQSFSLNEKY